MPKSYVTSKAVSGKLSSRWAHFGPQKQKLEQYLHQSSLSSEDLPPPLDAAAIRKLMQDLDSHQLEHGIAEAVRHTASLKQIRDHEIQKTKAPSAFEPKLRDVAHAYESWKQRLVTLEMIAAARDSLRSLRTNEREAVAKARMALCQEEL